MNRKEYIFKKLKEHYNYIKQNYPNYNVIYLGLQGSQNYELDIYTEEYTSDVDTKAILVPSLMDIAQNKKPISTTVILPDNSNCDCKDIRLMMENFKKQNINFIEILFTEFRIINSQYKDIILDLLRRKEDIAHLNTNQALRCMCGMSMEKRKALCHPYPTLLNKIQKYGYDGKQLHHIIRMNDFIKCYIKGMSYNECLTNYEDKQLLMDAKLSKFTLKEALQIADKYNEDTHNIMVNNLLEQDVVNEDTKQFMLDIQYRIIQREIQLEFDKTIEKQHVFSYDNIDTKYNNIFVTSDLHFYHSNILKYEPGRLNLISESIQQYVNRKLKENNESGTDEEIDNYMNSYYKDKVLEMNDCIVDMWNRVVKPGDLVFILGDIALTYGDIHNVENILQRLNGDKILIKGNHDISILQNEKFNKQLFKDIIDYKEVKLYSVTFVMSHYPIACFNKQYKGNVHLYGHMHSMPLPIEIRNSYKVCLDTNNYKPVNIKNVIQTINKML